MKGLGFYSGSMGSLQGTQMIYFKARSSAAGCGVDKVGVCGGGWWGAVCLQPGPAALRPRPPAWAVVVWTNAPS